MISQQEERLLRAWLDDEPAVLPTHVWYSVMADVASTRQRRRFGVVAQLLDERPTLRLLAVALLLLLLIATLVVGGGAVWQRLFAQPHPLPDAEAPLEAGVYVIDRPFPVRVAFDVPAGWASIEAGSGRASLRRDRDNGPAIILGLPDKLYLDACDPDRGFQRGIGPAPADLVAAMAAVDSITPDTPAASNLGAYKAEHVAVRAPAGPAACTTHPDEPPYQLWWGVGIGPDERADIWSTEADGRRLAVALVVPPGTLPADVAEAKGVLASIKLGDAAPQLEPTPLPVEPPQALTDRWPAILPGVPTGDVGELVIPAYADGAGSQAAPVPGRYVLSLAPPAGWVGTAHGVAAPDGTAAIEAWSIGAIHPDPCHWRTSRTSVLGKPLDDLAAALAGGWSKDPESGAPVTTRWSDAGWISADARLVDLAAPEDVDPAACDDGRLVAWESRDGAQRPLQPGERIRLRIPNLHPGVVVVAFSSAGAASATLEAASNAVPGVWVGDATPFSGP
jgi:hypothetical protein